MLIIYRTNSGEIIEQTGTNSLHPWGPPDEVGYANTDAAGIDRDDVGLVRLHDQDDAELVSQLVRRGGSVVDGRVVLGPEPDPEEQSPAEASDAAPVTRAEYEALRQRLDELLAQLPQ